ncbi:MAG: DUF3570 domain-containing protein, partial [Gammaproteobacteria bacterium]
MAKRDRDVVQSALTVLTSAAMALPGVSRAITPPEKPELSFRWEMYNEDITSEENNNAQVPFNRYDIDAYYFHLVLPYSEKLSFTASMDYETMSGATPWYVTRNNDDPEKAEVVLTGASVDDERLDVSGSGTYYIDEGALTVSGGTSREEDYVSLYGGVSAALEFYDKHVVGDIGVSFSSDKLSPTPSSIPLPIGDRRVIDASKSSASLYAGFTQVLNRISTYQMGMSYTVRTGFLSDPYKEVAIIGDTNSLQRFTEARPDDRKQFAWTHRYRLYLEESGTAFHGDYRYYSDNWSISSHTMDGALYRRRNDILLVGGLRYYTQDGADFYEPFYVGQYVEGNFYSSDYRLSDFSSLSWRVHAEKEFNGWTGIVSYELYDVDGDSPALIDFDILSVG